jgi:hypothetical protein
VSHQPYYPWSYPTSRWNDCILSLLLYIRDIRVSKCCLQVQGFLRFPLSLHKTRSWDEISHNRFYEDLSLSHRILHCEENCLNTFFFFDCRLLCCDERMRSPWKCTEHFLPRFRFSIVISHCAVTQNTIDNFTVAITSNLMPVFLCLPTWRSLLSSTRIPVGKTVQLYGRNSSNGHHVLLRNLNVVNWCIKSRIPRTNCLWRCLHPQSKQWRN